MQRHRVLDATKLRTWRGPRRPIRRAWRPALLPQCASLRCECERLVPAALQGLCTAAAHAAIRHRSRPRREGRLGTVPYLLTYLLTYSLTYLLTYPAGRLGPVPSSCGEQAARPPRCIQRHQCTLLHLHGECEDERDGHAAISGLLVLMCVARLLPRSAPLSSLQTLATPRAKHMHCPL